MAPISGRIYLFSAAQLGFAKIARALLLRMIFFQKSFAQGLYGPSKQRSKVTQGVISRSPRYAVLQLHLLKDLLWDVHDYSHDKTPEEWRVDHRLSTRHRFMNSLAHRFR